MDSNSQHNYQHQNHQPNSGLLRFRSAPSSLLNNFAEGCVGSGANKGSFTEGSEPERLISRFLNFSGSADSASPGFQDFEDKPPVAAATEAAVNRASSQQGYSGGLPPHYPRYSTTATTPSPMDGSYGVVGSMAMDHHVQAKAVNSNIVRQNSSPSGLFSQIPIPNGNVLVLVFHVRLDALNICYCWWIVHTTGQIALNIFIAVGTCIELVVENSHHYN